MPNKSYRLERSPFYRLGTRRDLATLIRVSMKELKALSGSAHLYCHWDVAKKNGGRRRVDNPRDDLKRVQKRIASLLSRIMPPEFLFCPVKGRSYVDNAAMHRGNRVVHMLDVEAYFPSTPSRRIYWFFHNVMHCATDVAAVLAKIACCDGHLPTGSPLSPVMAYYAHVDIWEEVARIARENGCIVTIYVDDVTVSGARVPMGVIWQMKQAIHRGGLRWHKGKEKRSVDRWAEVTGVGLLDGKLELPNRQRAKIRDLKQAKDRERDPVERRSLTGKLAGLKGQVAQIAAGSRGECLK
jgi:hypothetical protein